MKQRYDWSEHTETRICQACGYTHTKELGYYGKTIEGDDKFIEMEGLELHSTDRSDSWHSSHNTHTIYACPKCGVLQIEM